MKMVLSFEPSNKQDAELHKFLKQLGYGKFTAGTKLYWLEVMRKEKEDEGK